MDRELWILLPDRILLSGCWHLAKGWARSALVLVLARTGLTFCSRWEGAWPGHRGCSVLPHFIASGQGQEEGAHCGLENLAEGAVRYWLLQFGVLFACMNNFFSFTSVISIIADTVNFLISTLDLCLLCLQLEGERGAVHGFSGSTKLENIIPKP